MQILICRLFNALTDITGHCLTFEVESIQLSANYWALHVMPCIICFIMSSHKHLQVVLWTITQFNILAYVMLQHVMKPDCGSKAPLWPRYHSAVYFPLQYETPSKICVQGCCANTIPQSLFLESHFLSFFFCKFNVSILFVRLYLHMSKVLTWILV